MQLALALSRYAGLSEQALFRSVPPLARIQQNGSTFTVPVWNVPNVATPTAAQIAAFLAAADPAATPAALLAYASKKQNIVLAQVWAFNVGTTSAPVMLTTKLDASGQTAMQKLLLWGKILANALDTQAYNMADGTAGPSVTPLQAVSLATQASVVETQTYATLNQVSAGITASPPTITTTAQIDSASWPSPAALKAPAAANP